MKSTVIFDMDGVIVDTEPIHRYAYFKHFNELSVDVSEELFSTFTGKSTKNVYERLKDKHSIILEEVNDLVLRKRAIFNDAFDTKPDLYLIDGVEALIKDLYNSGLQLILASSASRSTIDRVFNRFNLTKYFTHQLSGEDFKQSKPNPEIFLQAVKLSKDLPENCVVIEDSTSGINAALAANIQVIGYNSKNSTNQELKNATWICEDFNHINADYIKNLE